MQYLNLSWRTEWNIWLTITRIASIYFDLCNKIVQVDQDSFAHLLLWSHVYIYRLNTFHWKIHFLSYTNCILILEYVDETFSYSSMLFCENSQWEQWEIDLWSSHHECRESKQLFVTVAERNYSCLWPLSLVFGE